MGSTGIIRTHGGHSLIGGGLSGITSSSGEREKDINIRLQVKVHVYLILRS